MKKELSNKQIELLEGLSNHLTVKQIAKHHNKSRQSVYKGINKLLNKGYIKRLSRGIFEIQKTVDSKLIHTKIYPEYKTQLKMHKLKYLNKFCYFCNTADVIDQHHIIERCSNGSSNTFPIINNIDLKRVTHSHRLKSGAFRQRSLCYQT